MIRFEAFLRICMVVSLGLIVLGLTPGCAEVSSEPETEFSKHYDNFFAEAIKRDIYPNHRPLTFELGQPDLDAPCLDSETLIVDKDKWDALKGPTAVNNAEKEIIVFRLLGRCILGFNYSMYGVMAREYLNPLDYLADRDNSLDHLFGAYFLYE